MNRALHCALIGTAALAAGAGCSKSDAPAGSQSSGRAQVKTPGTPEVVPARPAAVNADCRTLTNPVYMPTTSLVGPLMAKVAPILADPSTTTGVGPTDQMTIIQFVSASCIAYEAVTQHTEVSGTGVYYVAGSSTPLNCDLPAGTGIKADLNAMDVGGATCLGTTPPPEFHEAVAHVETLAFVVPKNSTQQSITATEAYYLMKFAGAAGKEIPPWTDPNFVHVRNGGSSTQLTIGNEIRLPGTMWNSLLQGNLSSGGVASAIIADNTNGNAEKSIGILDSAKYEPSFNNMRVLAFQPFNQCIGAIFPDSTEVSRDKRNVRDGHYPLWTNLRYIQEYQSGNPFSGNGQASADRTKRFIDIMDGASTATNLDVSLAVLQTGGVPGCAMHVGRDYDGGEIKPFTSSTPCDCYFDKNNNVINPNCVACTGTGQGTCTGTGEQCRQGYCEPR